MVVVSHQNRSKGREEEAILCSTLMQVMHTWFFILFKYIYDLGVATLLDHLAAFMASIPLVITASSASPSVTHTELPQGVPTSFMPQRSAG
jgi:hypothetical protein